MTTQPEVGLVAGVNQDEHEAYGFSWDHRYDRLEETLTIIHGLFRDGHVDFEGRCVSARDCELGLRGPRSAGPPILLGGKGPRIQRLAARFAGLWNVGFFGDPSDLDTVAGLGCEVDDACAEVGRAASNLERTAALMVHLGGPPAMVGPYDWSAGALRGSVAEVASSLLAFAAVGISHLQVGLVPSTRSSIESFARVLELLDRGAGYPWSGGSPPSPFVSAPAVILDGAHANFRIPARVGPGKHTVTLLCGGSADFLQPSIDDLEVLPPDRTDNPDGR